ncbi:hypothetical protein BJ165DRAFT_264220 [Panaeolus papilionaceus]|nr:hypothetical protein BJ165DRAFT_264220 [Panaeolus papilionaceus]
MGKLNIAHHKSYHPYRRDNIERVRRDEEEAQQKEAQEEGRMLLADSEARMDLLRERAGLVEGGPEKKKKKHRNDDDMKAIASGSSMTPAVLPTTNGHINLFEDLEQLALAAAIKSTKKSGSSETEKGVPLAPSAKDLNPWYSGKGKDKQEEDGFEEKRRRDESRKNVHDPLTSITRQLASRSSGPSSSHSSSRRLPTSLPRAPDAPPQVHARLTREMSERERAQELIRRKRKEMEGNATPSTVADDGYRDVFNRREVDEAHRQREQRYDPRIRKWDHDSRDSRRRH